MAAPASTIGSSSVSGFEPPAFLTHLKNSVNKEFETVSSKVNTYISLREAKIFSSGIVTGLGLALLNSAKFAGTFVASNPTVVGLFTFLAGLGMLYTILKGRAEVVSTSHQQVTSSSSTGHNTLPRKLSVDSSSST